MNAERIAREVVLVAAALAVAAVIGHAVAPGEFPNPDGQNFHAEKQRFYNQLLLAQLIVLPAWMVTYYLLRKLYGRWRGRSVAAGARGAGSPAIGADGGGAVD